MSMWEDPVSPTPCVRARSSQTLPPGGGMGKPGFPIPLRGGGVGKPGFPIPLRAGCAHSRSHGPEPGAPHPPARGLRPPKPSPGRGYGGTWFPHVHVRKRPFPRLPPRTGSSSLEAVQNLML